MPKSNYMSDYERGIPSSKSSWSPRHRLRARICIPCEGVQQRYNNDRYNDGMCSQTISLQPSSASRSPPPPRQARYDAQTSVSSSDLLALQTGSSGLVATGQYDYSARRETYQSRSIQSSLESFEQSTCFLYCQLVLRRSRTHTHRSFDDMYPHLRHVSACQIYHERVKRTHALPSCPFERSVRVRTIRPNG